MAREARLATGTKYRYGVARCGACGVHLNGNAISCTFNSAVPASGVRLPMPACNSVAVPARGRNDARP